ncbi:MAG: LAGLIDADG family homing endonuclease, partial [archaeon]
LHKEHFDNIRKKANKIRKDCVKYNFDINMPLSKDLCLFIGAFIGDGFTNVYNAKTYHSQISGDKGLDSDYYYNILKPICKDLFGIEPYIYERKNNNGINFNLYSKRIYELLTKRFKMQRGVKCYTVQIPQEILSSEKSFLNASLRGMFDTDGGVGIDKRSSYKKPYIRINYTSSSDALIRQLTKILTDYFINHSIHKKGNTQMIQINGEENIKKFMKEIGFANKRHLDKINKHL